MFLTDNITLIVLIVSAIAAAMLVGLDQFRSTQAGQTSGERVPSG